MWTFKKKNMQEDFHIALFSNSSFKYFPENKTTHFVTKLPKHINLQGRWAVGLLDIHIPLNFQNVGKEEEERRVIYSRTDDREFVGQFTISPGIYENVGDLVKELNSYQAESHIEFIIKPGSYVVAQKNCGNLTCDFVRHKFDLPVTLKRILGFRPDRVLSSENLSHEISSDFPANLNANLPTNLFIYASICESWITGDIYSKLLRNVALDLNPFTYGRTLSMTFLRPIYVPLLTTTFETIEILIRDGTGKKVPLDHGTLALTLHFKRIS